eukprot:gene13924-18673_t
MRLLSLLLQLFLVHVLSMPYQVPLQGGVGGKRTLILLDDLGKIASFSIFFSKLTSRGHKLSFFQVEAPDLKLQVFGENLYDNIIFLAPTTEKFSTITFEDLIEFSDQGGNLMIGLNREMSDSVREFVESFGVNLDKKGTEVIDHFATEKSLDLSIQHVNILSKGYTKSGSVLGSYLTIAETENLPILFHGVGHTVEDSNILTVKVLTGNPSTYSASPNKPTIDKLESAGQNTVLVSAIQARNNARVVISGSIDMLTNQFVKAKLTSPGYTKTGNELFLDELTKWAFAEKGVLRFRNITHHKIDGTPPDVILHEKERPDLPLSLYPDPEITRNSLVYRIKDEIVYNMIVEEYKDGSWHPFSADDMQMEFVMLDPHVRKTMSNDPKTGNFQAVFIAPDNYGVFKFRVLYRRPGYSVLHAETQVSIRPFKHNEYERFIFSAYPYYSSAISATIAVFVFSIFYLFSAEETKAK